MTKIFYLMYDGPLLELNKMTSVFCSEASFFFFFFSRSAMFSKFFPDGHPSIQVVNLDLKQEYEYS